MNKYDTALKFATRCHEGQKRWNGEPYIKHPIRVSESSLLYTEDEKIAALLHDVQEDCGITNDEIKEKFGDKVAKMVDLLTKKPGHTYTYYIEMLYQSKDPGAISIKLADLEDNMSDLKKGSMLDKYELTYSYLIR